MKTNQLSNTVRALILIIAIIILTIVSSKADMIKATYSPYKCNMETSKHKDISINMKITILFDKMDDISVRKFNFKNHTEDIKTKEEVRRYDVTSSKQRILITVFLPDCEMPLYKII